MTTAQHTSLAGYRTTTVGTLVRRASAATAAAGLVSMVLAAVLAEAAAVAGAVIGTVLVCGFFGLGALVLGTVTRLAPAASLLIAMLTYTLKVVLVGLVFLSLDRSGALDGSVDARWLGGTVIACTMVWMVSQILFSIRARQPLYDLDSDAGEPSVR